nr:hypothetical protein Itr_chr06CG02540 [Ipomoea trifida]
MDPHVPGITGQPIEHFGTELALVLPILHDHPVSKRWLVPVPAGTSFPVKLAAPCKLRAFIKPYFAKITVIPVMDLNASDGIICPLRQNLLPVHLGCNICDNGCIVHPILPVHLGCNICDNGCTVHPTEAKRHI